MSLRSADADLPVRFHVQAGTRVGMGHIARSAALMAGMRSLGIACDLSLDADAPGIAFARARGLTPNAGPDRPCAALIIDALDLPGPVRAAAAGVCPRILVSPVCADADIATHVALRDMPPDLAGQLAPTARVVTDPDFAFVTAQGLTRRACDYDSLHIGLCLSGGVDRLALDPLVDSLLAAPDVARLTVIDPRRPAQAETPGGRVRHVAPGPDPWYDLSGINLFIGGDGVMLAEAVAQAIPAISLTTAQRAPKNAALVATGAMTCVLRGDKMGAQLTRTLSDLNALGRMHARAWQLDGPSRAAALPRAIVTMLHDTPKGTP